MNARQTLFCNGILSGLSAAASAEKAGYSKRTAYSIGPRLLKNVEIRKFIKTQQSEILKNTKTSTETVIKKLWSLYHSTKSESIKLKSLELLGRHTGAWLSVRDLLCELSQDELLKLIQSLNGK